MKKKSNVFSIFKEFKVKVELEFGKIIKCLRTDNGEEYTIDDFITFCEKDDIKRQFLISNTSYQIGVAERTDKTISKRIRSMLQTVGQKSF